jgi:hypothetical protein
MLTLQKKESTPDAATQRLSFSERRWINSRERRRHVEWNRFRLAAQLKAAVEQLDILILAFEATSSKISKSSWPETQAKTKLSDYFKEKFASGVLPGELRPQDWTRFSDNVYDMVRSSPLGHRKYPLHISNEVSTVMD